MNFRDVSFPEEIIPLHPLALKGIPAPHPGKLNISPQIMVNAAPLR
jgi:hypothetical protein